MEKKSENFVSRRYGIGRIDKVPRPPRSTRKKGKRTPPQKIQGKGFRFHTEWTTILYQRGASKSTGFRGLPQYRYRPKPCLSGSSYASPEWDSGRTTDTQNCFLHYVSLWHRLDSPESQATKNQELAIMVDDELLVRARDTSSSPPFSLLWKRSRKGCIFARVKMCESTCAQCH